MFLDRDGVLIRAYVRNGKPYPPQSMAEVQILPGVPETLTAFKKEGLLLIVATNQPDVVTGATSRVFVEAVHALLRDKLPLDRIMVCYDTDRPESQCYKPKPGMLLEAATDLGIDLSNSFMIGDRWRDIGAGRAAGCRTVLIGDGYPGDPYERPHFVARDMAEAGIIVLRSIAAAQA